MSIPTRDTVTKWLLDADQHKKELDSLYRSYRRQERQEKQLDFIRQKLDSTTEGLEKSTRSLSESTGDLSSRMDILGKSASVAIGNLASAALAKASAKFGELVGESEAYSQASRIYTGDIEAARKATRGLATDLDLMQASNKLATLGVKMSDQEFTKMLGALDKVSMAMGRDIKNSLQDVTTMLARQSTAVADNIGVIIKADDAYKKYADGLGKTASQLTQTEKRTAFQQEALEQLFRKAEETGPAMTTLTGAVTQLGVAFWNAATAAGAFVNTLPAQVMGEMETKAQHMAQAWRDLQLAEKMLAGYESGKVKLRGAGLLGVGTTEERKTELRQRIEILKGKYAMLSSEAATTLAKEHAKDLDTAAGEYALSYVKTVQDAELKKIETIAKRYKETRGVKPEKGIKGIDYTPGLTPEQYKKQQDDLTKFYTQSGEIQSLVAWSMGEIDAAQKEYEASLEKISAKKKADLELTKKQIAAYEMMADATSEFSEATMRAAGFTEAFIEKAAQLHGVRRAVVELGEIGKSALSSLASGFWESIEAAIKGEEEIGDAMAKVAESVLYSVATQATIKALYEAAEAIAAAASNRYAEASEHTAAAALFAAVAVAAGGVAAGVSAAMGSSSTAGASSSSSSASSSGSSPSYGRSVSDTSTININVYIGDKDQPGATAFAQKQLYYDMKGAGLLDKKAA